MVTADVLHRKWSLPSSQRVYGAEFIRSVAEYQEPLAEADVFSLMLSAVSAWKQTSSGWHLLVTTTGVRSIKWCPLRWYYPDKNVISSCICDLEIFSQCKMLGHHACHILNHYYTLMRDKLSHIFDHNDVPPNIKPPFNRIFCARNMPLTYPTSCSSIECFMLFCSFFDSVFLSCHSSLREDISQSSTFGLHPSLLPIGNCVRFILALSWQTILSHLKRFMLAQSWQTILSYLRRFMLALSWKMISSHFWIGSRWVQSKIWRFNHSLLFCL